MVFGGTKIQGASNITRTDAQWLSATQVGDKITASVSAERAQETLEAVAGKLLKGKQLAIHHRTSSKTPRFIRQSQVSTERATHTVAVVRNLFAKAGEKILDPTKQQELNDAVGEYLSADNTAIKGEHLGKLVQQLKDAIAAGKPPELDTQASMDQPNLAQPNLAQPNSEVLQVEQSEQKPVEQAIDQAGPQGQEISAEHSQPAPQPASAKLADELQGLKDAAKGRPVSQKLPELGGDIPAPNLPDPALPSGEADALAREIEDQAQPIEASQSLLDASGQINRNIEQSEEFNELESEQEFEGSVGDQEQWPGPTGNNRESLVEESIGFGTGFDSQIQEVESGEAQGPYSGFGSPQESSPLSRSYVERPVSSSFIYDQAMVDPDAQVYLNEEDSPLTEGEDDRFIDDDARASNYLEDADPVDFSDDEEDLGASHASAVNRKLIEEKTAAAEKTKMAEIAQKRAAELNGIIDDIKSDIVPTLISWQTQFSQIGIQEGTPLLERKLQGNVPSLQRNLNDLEKHLQVYDARPDHQSELNALKQNVQDLVEQLKSDLGNLPGYADYLSEMMEEYSEELEINEENKLFFLETIAVTESIKNDFGQMLDRSRLPAEPDPSQIAQRQQEAQAKKLDSRKQRLELLKSDQKHYSAKAYEEARKLDKLLSRASSGEPPDLFGIDQSIRDLQKKKDEIASLVTVDLAELKGDLQSDQKELFEWFGENPSIQQAFRDPLNQVQQLERATAYSLEIIEDALRRGTVTKTDNKAGTVVQDNLEVKTLLGRLLPSGSSDPLRDNYSGYSNELSKLLTLLGKENVPISSGQRDYLRLALSSNGPVEKKLNALLEPLLESLESELNRKIASAQDKHWEQVMKAPNLTAEYTSQKLALEEVIKARVEEFERLNSQIGRIRTNSPKAGFAPVGQTPAPTHSEDVKALSARTKVLVEGSGSVGDGDDQSPEAERLARWGSVSVEALNQELEQLSSTLEQEIQKEAAAKAVQEGDIQQLTKEAQAKASVLRLNLAKLIAEMQKVQQKLSVPA